MTSALIGALLGDSIGAPLEFYYNKEITNNDIKNCLELKGGGIFKVGPGQITDERASAIPFFCIKNNLSLKKALELSIIDSQLTHPNQICKDTAIIYTYSMYNLLKGYKSF